MKYNMQIQFSLSSVVVIIFSFAIGLFGSIANAQNIIYVNQSATGGNNGSSWQDAYVSLQDAIGGAQGGDQLWVAAGIYKPDIGQSQKEGDRSAMFSLTKGVSLYGGFKGDETNISSREKGLHTTTLSGDLLNNDPVGSLPIPSSSVYDDNSNQVLGIQAESETQKVIIDGITIKGATPTRTKNPGIYANGPYCSLIDVHMIENIGQTIAAFTSCSITRLRVTRNYSTAPGVLQLRASTIRDSIFEDNISDAKMGGMVEIYSQDSVFVIRTLFINNTAPDGGAISSTGTHLVVISSIFIGNVAKCSGGAINMDERGSLTSTNNVYAYNESLANCNVIVGGGALMIYNSKLSDFNSTYYGNKAYGGGDVLALRQSEGSIVNSIWNANNKNTDDVDLNLSSLNVGYILHDEDLSEVITESGPVIIGSATFASPTGIDEVPGTMDDNFQLSSGSLGLNVGNIESLPQDLGDLDGDGIYLEPTPHDVLGMPRISNNSGAQSINLGAYEQPIPTGTETNYEVPSDSCFEVYPNPFQSGFRLDFGNEEPSSFIIYNMIGRKMVEETTISNSADKQIPTSDWSAGIYLILSTRKHGCVKLVSKV